jgi:ribonuclease HI
MAELWGVFEGLILAKKRGVTKLELRVDSEVIVKSLQVRKNGSIMGCTLMKKMYKILENFQEVRIIHVFREANLCADMLANISCNNIGSINIVYFEHPPSKVTQIVDDDYMGVSFSRFLNM